jgi:hypothetical protein
MLHSLYILSAIALLAFSTSAFELNIGATDTQQCPFKSDITVLPDHSGLSIKWHTPGTTFASVNGSSTSPSKAVCYYSIDFRVNPNRRITFSSLSLDAPAQLDEGVTAKVSTDIVWDFWEYEGKLSQATLTGPHSGAWSINQTDTAKPYQSNCGRQTNREDGSGTAGPRDTGIHIRTVIDFSSSSATAKGAIGRDGVVEQVLKFTYDEPCPPMKYENPPVHQFCGIDRAETYTCTCPGEEGLDKYGVKNGPCEKWDRFPPWPMSS